MAHAVVATRAGGPEVLELVEVPLDPPGPDEIRVDVRAAGVNPVDAKSYRGGPGSTTTFPLRLGYEAAGVVSELGNGEEATGGVGLGDEVIVYRVSGAYADEVVVKASGVLPKPPSMGWPEAGGLMLAGATAMHALVATGVGEGDTVLVHAAAGGVGLMAVQLARLRGAHVIGTASDRNHALLRELGAEPVTYGAGLADRVRALAPDGVSAAVDAIGSDDALDASLELVADRGRIAELVVGPRSREAGVLLLGGAPGADPGTEIRAAARPELARLAGDGSLRVIVAATYPLAEAADAHRAIMAGRTVGKIVLVP